MKINNKNGSIKVFIVPFIIITLIFVLSLISMSHSIKNYYYDMKKEESLTLAQIISTNLENAGLMTDTANKLLEDNLLTALKTTALYSERVSYELLGDLADAFEIDEMYVYNSQGIINYSYSGKYLGWQAYVGHPVYNFIRSDDDIYREDIRKDSESDLYYKYGYIKSSDGNFVQIAILAKKIQAMLESFELQHLLEQIGEDKSIINLFTVDMHYRITASIDKDLIGARIQDDHIRPAVYEDKIKDHIINTEDGEIYEIFVPLQYESDKISAFGIQYTMEDIVPVIRYNTLIGVVGLGIIYISLVFAVFVIYKRNKELTRIAFFDHETGLPNRQSFKRLQEKDLEKDNNKAIIMIGCDKLSLINILYGYEVGDLIIKKIGERLKDLENPNVRLFKFTENKFILYANNYENRQELFSYLDKVTEALSQPFIINNSNEHVVTRIGVVSYKQTEKTLDQLLKQATIALKALNSNKNSDYNFFNEDMELKIQREETIERELSAALAGQGPSELYLVYQPIINMETNKIESFEALTRMNSQEYGFVSPLEFIEIAEKRQLIMPLTNFVLKEASKFIKDLVGAGFEDARVAINISSVCLNRKNFVSQTLGIIRELGIDGRNIELEITESSLLDNYELVNKKLKELRDNGITIAIDDFGLGYSSFARLSELNVDVVKIDKLFIDDIQSNNKASLITKDIISIAHRLGLKTVAEGVETQEQRDYLDEHECDNYQGYLFSKPVQYHDAMKLVTKHNKGR